MEQDMKLDCGFTRNGNWFRYRVAAIIIENGGMFDKLKCHEVTFYYLMKPRGTQELNSDSYCPEGREFMSWIPISDLKDIKAYPAFFAKKLINLPETVEHIVTKDLHR